MVCSAVMFQTDTKEINMTLPTDFERPKPSAFSPDPNTQSASLTFLTLAAGFDTANQQRLDEAIALKWQGVVAQIEMLGPDHGKAILTILNPIVKESGISLAASKVAIEMYCRDNYLRVPEIPEEAKTMVDGFISQIS